MGFSALGLALSLALLLPSLLLIRYPPDPALPDAAVPPALVFVERGGQALCMTVPALTVGVGVRWGWAVPVLVCAFAYWVLWGRYFACRRSPAALFGPVWGIPVPMALLPVAAFLTGSAWLMNPWMLIAACLLAAGHIPASLIIWRAVRSLPAADEDSRPQPGPAV